MAKQSKRDYESPAVKNAVLSSIEMIAASITGGSSLEGFSAAEDVDLTWN